MVEYDGDFVALAETTVFLSYFKEMPDHRQPGKVLYLLDEVLLSCLLAGAEAFTDIARFGEKKQDLLRRFRPFANGRPRMIIWAIFSPRSMRKPSSAASWRGFRFPWRPQCAAIPSQGGPFAKRRARGSCRRPRANQPECRLLSGPAGPTIIPALRSTGSICDDSAAA
jgi:hypothetical protein